MADFPERASCNESRSLSLSPNGGKQQNGTLFLLEYEGLVLVLHSTDYISPGSDKSEDRIEYICIKIHLMAILGYSFEIVYF